ncbi:dehydrogenase [Dendrothele bispora CBS 962.96]|uniref:Dehydrogenase n=1 Tax=Dendrothele bispora (strain CBS 962.96) TaxID=1314807 RepID=A0A4S8MT39_DENBC|nr:dehydrogenase [Dendrothele bispora CBS 962.96]
MNKMLAVCTTIDGTPELRQVDVPKIRPEEMLVKVIAAAQNPAEWVVAEWRKGKETAIIGCDFAGIVTQVGEAVTDFKIGERVAGMVHGCKELNGTYAEYVAALPYMTFKIPSSWSLEDASQLGVACYTACQCLYQSQDLPLPEHPTSEPFDILIWGAGSSVGHFTVQLAKLGGMRVIATASTKHFDRLKALGIDELFDYHDPDVNEKIKACTNGNLHHAVDCIANETTPKLISNALSTEGGTVSVVRDVESVRDEVKHVFSLAYELTERPFDFPWDYIPKPGMAAFARKCSEMISKLLNEGKLVPAPLKIYPNGFASVSEGFTYMKSGLVSGEKIVYRVEDTPGLQN